MVCADTALTCAVRELNETLQSGPDPWVVQLWVPLLVSLVTLAVSGVTVWLAWRSQELTRRSTKAAEEAAAASKRSADLADLIRRDELDRELRREREAALPQLRELAYQASMRAKPGGGRNIQALEDITTRAQIEAQALESPNGLELIAYVLQTFEDAPRQDDLRAYDHAAHGLIREWLRDPVNFASRIVERNASRDK